MSGTVLYVEYVLTSTEYINLRIYHAHSIVHLVTVGYRYFLHLCSHAGLVVLYQA